MCDLGDDLIGELTGSEYPEDVQAEAAKIMELFPSSASHATSAVCL